MKKWWAMLGGLGLGAGLMYILDPEAMRRRGRKKTVDGGGLRGVLAEAQDAIQGTEEEADEALAERVRGRIERSFPDAGGVRVSALNGVVTLSGTVPAAHFDRLVSAVLKVRGVHDVTDELDVRPSEGTVRGG
jgi:osmotically-inducible protein OsmY